MLTLLWLDGAHLKEFLAAKPPQEMRDRLMRLFFFQLFRVRVLHADPHPGNYLFGRDGSIGLVDSGCVKYLPPEVVEGYRAFWRRDWVADRKAFVSVVRIVWGARRSPDEPGMRPAMDDIRRFYDVFFPLDQTSAAIDFGDPQRAHDLTDLAKSILNNKLVSPEFVFLSRAESRLHSLLHALKARVRTTQIVLELMTGS